MSQQFIGKYEIVSTLGRGSMGVVYKAMDPEIGRLVAIKTLRSVFLADNASGAEALQRFRQESRSAGMLRHANIVMIYEAGRAENGSPYIVMEYIEGKSLEVVLSESGPVDPLGVVHYVAQIASALDYAHAQQVIHRDIKPSNILISAEHKPHLLDFGVAKLNDTSLTPAGTVVGTPSYMSPEQIRGEVLDGGTDIFALAVVTFELLTGVRPFPGKDFTSVVSSIINKPPQTFAQVESDLPIELEKILHKGVAKERGQRFATATEFVDAIADVLGVVVDSSGLAGGYNPELRILDVSSQETEMFQAAAIEHALPLTSEDSVTVPVDTSEHINGLQAEPESSPTASSTKKTESSGSQLFLTSILIFALIAGLAWNYFSRTFQNEELSLEYVFEVDPVKEPDRPVRIIEKPQNEPYYSPKAPSVPIEDIKSTEGLDRRELLFLLSSKYTAIKVKRSALDLILDKNDTNFVPVLVEAFRSTDDVVFRVNLLKAFADAPYSNSKKVLELLSEALNDQNHLIRGFAAKSLGKIASPEVAVMLKERFKVEDQEVVSDVIRLQLENMGEA